MSWSHALIATITGFLVAYIAFAAFVSWHRMRYVRRHRPMHAVCSPRVSRAWLKHWQVGGVAK